MSGKTYIIIVTWNGEKYIRDCLDSINNQTDSDFEIIVVDNKSSDATTNIIKQEYKNVLLIENETNLGFAGGNNLGILKALSLGAEYVALLNQDTEVSPEFVGSCKQFLRDNNDIHLVSPVVLYPREKRIWFAGAKIFRGKEILQHPTSKIGEHINKKKEFKGPAEDYKADWLSGCALFVKKEVFEKIGLLDDRLFMYGEDVDFSLRAVHAGFRLGIAWNVTIIHKEEINNKIRINLNLLKKAFYMVRARCTIVYRYYSFKEKCYYIIKLIYTPLFQLAYAIRKNIS
jgi:hypothetical protein